MRPLVVTALSAAFAMAGVWAQPARAQDGRGQGAPAPAQDEREAERAEILASLQTDVWEPPTLTFHPLWQLFAVPEHAVELALSPLAFAVRIVERYRLDQRIDDLLRNDEGTFAVTPNAKLSGGDGFGLGAKVRLENFLGADERFDVGGLVRLSGDFEVGVRLRQSIAFLEGRLLELDLDYELDQDIPYFGIGNDTDVADERVLSSSLWSARGIGDLFAIGTLDLFGRFELGLLRERLETGTDSSTPGFDPALDPMAAPGGFGIATSYVTGRLVLGTDSRDTIGRSTDGVLGELSIAGTSSMDADLRAVRLGVDVTSYWELAPAHRVLVLSAGSAWVSPAGGEEVPFFELVTLGREHGLRGHQRGRFRDRFGWWGSAEYRWLVYEYQDTGVGLAPVLFADVGRVAPDPTELVGSVHVSYGVGVRLAHESKFILSADLGFSKEGAELDFNLGTSL